MDDFCEWEVLHHNSENPSVVGDNSKELGDLVDELDAAVAAASSHGDGVIQTDYFSIEYQSKPSLSRGNSSQGDSSSVASNNPSWIDPASPGTLHLANNSRELWSDSGGDSPNCSHGLTDGGGSDIGETHEAGKGVNLDSELGFIGTAKVGSGDAAKDSSAKDDEILSDAVGGEDKGVEVSAMAAKEEDAADASSLELGAVIDDGGNNNSGKGMGNGDHEDRKASVVWWKVPLELLKYCMFKVRPVWTVSMAAAILGIVMLGRRLYRMKRKTQGLQLKVILDDKKVSQFMSRAARLNEAFSVVRRVPVVRPSLPATPGGVVPWPVMSMR